MKKKKISIESDFIPKRGYLSIFIYLFIYFTKCAIMLEA